MPTFPCPAVDTALTAEYAADLQQSLDILVTENAEKRLSLNSTKTETLVKDISKKNLHNIKHALTQCHWREFEYGGPEGLAVCLSINNGLGVYHFKGTVCIFFFYLGKLCQFL